MGLQSEFEKTVFYNNNVMCNMFDIKINQALSHVLDDDTLYRLAVSTDYVKQLILIVDMNSAFGNETNISPDNKEIFEGQLKNTVKSIENLYKTSSKLELLREQFADIIKNPELPSDMKDMLSASINKIEQTENTIAPYV